MASYQDQVSTEWEPTSLDSIDPELYRLQWTPNFLDDIDHDFHLPNMISSHLDDIDSEIYYYDYMRTFGVTELCEQILASLIPEILHHYNPQSRHSRPCPLRFLLNCRRISLKFRNTIDKSPELRQALFLEPMAGPPTTTNCIRVPHLAPFQKTSNFPLIMALWWGRAPQSSPVPMLYRYVKTSISIDRLRKWKRKGALWESMFVSQGPATTMELQAPDFRTTLKETGVERDGGIKFGDVMDEAKLFARSLSRKQRREHKRIEIMVVTEEGTDLRGVLPRN